MPATLFSLEQTVFVHEAEVVADRGLSQPQVLGELSTVTSRPVLPLIMLSSCSRVGSATIRRVRANVSAAERLSGATTPSAGSALWLAHPGRPRDP